VQTTLTQTRPLFSSYLRIRSLATSASSPELLQSRSELLSTLSALSADLADLVAAVAAVEHDPYRFGLDVGEVGRRRGFVRDVGGEVESMRTELVAVVDRRELVGGAAAGDDGDGESSGQVAQDPYGEFEHQLQLQMMHEQDEQLDDVFKTVGNLNSQAADIGRELEDQGVMLDEVNTVVDRVGGKLQNGMQKLGYVIRRNEGGFWFCMDWNSWGDFTLLTMTVDRYCFKLLHRHLDPGPHHLAGAGHCAMNG
jgi:member of the syntaxin family of t-SNAREs